MGSHMTTQIKPDSSGSRPGVTDWGCPTSPTGFHQSIALQANGSTGRAVVQGVDRGRGGKGLVPVIVLGHPTAHHLDGFVGVVLDQALDLFQERAFDTPLDPRDIDLADGWNEAVGGRRNCRGGFGWGHLRTIPVEDFNVGLFYHERPTESWGSPLPKLPRRGLGPVEIQDSQTVLFMIQASFWRRLE